MSYCQRGMFPIVETDSFLQYATALREPVLVTKEMVPDWIDGVDEEKYEYLICLETVDLTENRAVHSHDWIPARKMVSYLFS